MRGVGAGHQDHAAGEAVQAMHDAGALVAAGLRQRVEMVQQGVDQRSRMRRPAPA